MKSNTTKTKNYLGHILGKNLFIRGLDPSMSSFILGNRKTISIINTENCLNQLIKALYVLSKIIKTKGHFLIVNTNPEFSQFVENLIQQTSKMENVSYCNSKWVGGTLTNWNRVSRSIITFAKFSERFGAFLTINKIYFPKYEKMKKSFQGFIRKNDSQTFVSLSKKPDILLILNPNENRDVIKEANRLYIPVIAIADSNTNLVGITYPIPGNNNSVEFIHLFFSWIIRILKRV